MVGPSVKPLRSPLARAEIYDRDKVRNDEKPWRRLYRTKRWADLKARVFARDGLTCTATGAPLGGKHPSPNSPVCDHKIPVEVFWWDGRRHLFWDAANLQTVSKQWHDKQKQRMERAAWPNL